MTKQKRLRLRKIVDELLVLIWITVGAGISALALDIFLIPNSVLDGGATGVSMILHILTQKSIGIFILIINLPFLLLGRKHLGREFLLKALYGMIAYSVMLEVLRHATAITYDITLASIFGGILLGLGVGIVIWTGACLDGTEIVGIIISKKTSFSVGEVVLVFNIVIYGISAYLFGWDRALYSLLTYMLTSKVIDKVSDGFDQSKAVTIFTEDETIIAEKIYAKLGRTVTRWNGTGLVSADEKAILLCIVSRMEVAEVRAIAKEDENSAFGFVYDVNEVFGNHIKSKKYTEQILENADITEEDIINSQQGDV